MSMSEKIKRLNPLKSMFCVITLTIVAGFIAIVKYRIDINVVVDVIQMIVLPISLGFTALVIYQNREVQEISVELEKIKMTNDFINGFRKIMKTFNIHSVIKDEYYNDNADVKNLIESIKKSETLGFQEDSLDHLLTDRLTFEKLNKYISVTKEKDNKNIDKYIEICKKVNYIDSYANPENFHIMTNRYLEIVKAIDDKYNKRKNEIKKAEPSKVKIKTENSNNQRKREIKQANRIYALAVRQEDNNLLNDMECLLFNVNFDLLNYDQLYHLIIVPFKGYMNSFYLDIYFSHVNGLKRNELLYSNIINFYKILNEIELSYKENMNKSRNHANLLLDNQKNSHIKPIN